MSAKRMCFHLLLVLGLGSWLHAATVVWVSDTRVAGREQGWIDVLEANGYTVDLSFQNQQGRSLDAAEIAALEAADLILIARDMLSAEYSNQTSVWNGLTTPLIMVNGWLPASNRWNWVSVAGNAERAISNLEAMVPDHPVFAGVALEANNQVSMLTATSQFPTTSDPGNGTLIARNVSNNDVWIVEWQPGQEFYPGAGQTAGGPRMLFVAASQPAPGQYNLTAEGEKVFLNAVSYMLSIDLTPVASGENPADGATDVPRDVILSWTPGPYGATHDVYFGTSFADVDGADAGNPLGVLASAGQDANAFDPDGLLEFDGTYYWRVDDVNAPPDSTVFKGHVWSFTVEPFGYPIVNVTATASSAQASMGPQNTVNGSGLNANDEHSTELTQMWMSDGTQPNWIQFEFDAPYKLHELWVWNSNQIIEAVVGFGVKDVMVEYSLDGSAWTALDGVPEFARATGMPTYTHNTTIPMGGAVARYVRLTINSSWGGLPQAGLSEVRFFYVPVQARLPEPAASATGVSIDTDLSWRPGREATSHEVYFGTDENAMILVDTVTEHSYMPASLEFGTTYYWKVNEVGDADAYEGNIWSFTTQEYATIEDFESYNDDDNRIFDTWIDGWVNNTGSQVGYDVSPFAERMIVHGGRQSMPLKYDNTASPFLSEAERTFATAQNWTTNGADTLSLYFQGLAPGFAETASGSIFMNAVGTDIWNNGDQFRFAYKTLNGNGTMVARVESIYNSNVWAKGGVMIRQSIEPGSTHAFMPITPGGSGGGNGASFQRRLAANGASTNNDSTTVVAAPYWVKIERVGDAFSGSISPDGVTWTQLGTAQTITMTNPVLIGLALCSHDAAIATSAEFSNISTTGNVTGAWQVAEIGVEQPAGNSIEPLYVTITDSSGKAKMVSNPDVAATGSTGWQQWKIPLSEFTSAGVKMNAVKTMTIGVGSKTNPAAGGAGTLYIDDIGYGRPAQ